MVYCLFAVKACIEKLVNKRTKEQFVLRQTDLKNVLARANKLSMPTLCLYDVDNLWDTKDVNRRMT